MITLSEYKNDFSRLNTNEKWFSLIRKTKFDIDISINDLIFRQIKVQFSSETHIKT